VFDGLSRRNQATVEGRAVLKLFNDLFTLCDNALDSFASLAAGCLSEQFEYLLKQFDLTLGLVTVLQEARLAFFRLRGAGQLRKGLQDLLLGKINIFQRTKKRSSWVYVAAIGSFSWLAIDSPIQSVPGANGSRSATVPILPV
jgi:hypothetical protein